MASHSTGSPITEIYVSKTLVNYQTNYNFTNSTVAPPSCTASETDPIQIKVLKTVLYSIVMFVAFVGNIFIIAVVYRNKAMRKTTNIFIANMAASDMLIALLVIPRILVELYYEPWRWLISGIFGEITCKLTFFAVEFSIFISMISHAVIAVDRFWAIVYPLRPPVITSSRRKYIVAVMWLTAFLMQSPNLYSVKLSTNKDGKSYCYNDWYPLDNLTVYETQYIISAVVVFLIPILIMLVLYISLVVSMIRSKNATATQTSQVKRQRRKEDIVVLRKVVIMLSVFFISLIPIHVLSILIFFFWKGQIPCTAEAWAFSFTAFFLYLSNSAVNPCLCIILYKSYRCKFKKLFPWKYIMNVTSPLSSSMDTLGGGGNDDVNCTMDKRQTDKALELLPMSILNVYFKRISSSSNLS